MECDLCKRTLSPTMHTKDGFRVEAYRLVTGETIPVSMRDENDEEIKYMKVQNPRTVMLCDVCLKIEEVKNAVEMFNAPI